MLSAPKEEERLAVVSFTANDSNRGGFGKVLKSIEGLQQRLEDFSVEDVGQAEERAKTLAVRLSELHRRLATLTEINEAIRAVDAAVEQVSKENTELTKAQAQGADKLLQLQALVQANKLIRFPRLAKAARESSRAVSVHPIAKDSQSHLSLAETAITTGTPNQDPTERFSTQSARLDNTLEKPTAEPELEATESETTTASSNLQKAQDLSSPKPRLEPEAAPQTHSLDTDEAAFEATVHIAPAPEPTLARPDVRTSETNTSADFDQRLLDDLIKNYGEFAVSANLPATIKPAKDPAAKQEKRQEQVESKGRAERSTIKNVPGIKKQGELDRQLKKIIKDYGEYDLYSHRSPVNLKTGVIGAFLLLAVLFLGFYFFSMKSQPPQDSSVTQPISDSSAPGGSAAPSATNKEHRAGAGGSQDIQNRSSLKQKK